MLLLERTYGCGKLSYLSAYCVYTSASVMVQDAKAGDVLASRKTETFLRALNTAAKTCELIQRSLDIITNSLNAEPPPPRSLPVGPNQTSGDSLSNRQYLPAFLYRDTQINFASTSNIGSGMDVDASSLLDCYPEQHMEHSTSDWYLPP